jgi:UDP-N-acetylmuramate dehydrogenase
MNWNLLYEKLIEINTKTRVFRNEPMKKHTNFRLGGPAKILVIPESEAQLIETVQMIRAQEANLLLIGNGTNLLIRDGGYPGVVVKINHQGMKAVTVEGRTITAEAGALLSTVSKRAQQAGLSGLEFAGGIPGSLGGAVYMNAGAYGGEMKDVVTAVRVLGKDGTVSTFSREDLAFGYRTSRFHQAGDIVLSVTMELEDKDAGEILASMKELDVKRTTKQPLDKPSAGSTFKRPEGDYAGRLIDVAGLRGLRYRGARVSPKHCGFVILDGQGCAKDVETLIGMIQKTVYDQFGVKLEKEVIILGDEEEKDHE